MGAPLAFKYRYLNAQGQASGFLANKATLDDEGLKLKDKTIPAASFLNAATRENRVVFAFTSAITGKPEGLAMEAYKVGAKALANEYNRIASNLNVKRRQAELEAQGRAHEMEVATCTCCSASIDMTGFPDSHEVFCPQCRGVGSANIPVKEQEKVRVCDKCGFYAVPKGVTRFYFYFLIVLYGFRLQRKHMCGPCMRSEAWKMLGGNLIFLLGVPVAITQLFRAYAGTELTMKAYKGLEGGNVAAKKGRVEEAARRYDEVSQRLRGSSIALFNKGRAFAMANRLPDATRAFEDSIQACSNFYPAADALAGCLAAQKKDPMGHPLLQSFKAESGPAEA